MTPLFLLFRERFGILPGAGIVGVLAIGTALLGLWKMEDSFGKDLNFIEQRPVVAIATTTEKNTFHD